ncbi:MAG: lipid A biosynthesis acyltransferase [Bacteroidetes bacterium]|nr:lipid A biosynthesis acyltransferase [Bacteroidota bacterium]
MYYLVYIPLWLVSLLPLRVLYVFSDIAYGFVFYLFKYRRDVVRNNLKIAFPEKSEQERYAIEKQFYHNLTDTFIESIKFITISKKQILRRSTGEYDMINDLIEKGKNVHIMAGHQFNWEFANLLYALNLKTPFVGIYMTIANKHLNRIFFNFRKQFGTILISAQEFKNKRFDVFQQQYCLALAADQNPGDPTNAYWMHFMGKPAPFVTGPSKGAVKNNTAVVIVGFRKVKRGYYAFTTDMLAEEGSLHSPEELTLIYKNALEKIIRKDPANYLWSHRRWKWEWTPSCPPVLDQLSE